MVSTLETGEAGMDGGGGGAGGRGGGGRALRTLLVSSMRLPALATAEAPDEMALEEFVALRIDSIPPGSPLGSSEARRSRSARAALASRLLERPSCSSPESFWSAPNERSICSTSARECRNDGVSRTSTSNAGI